MIAVMATPKTGDINKAVIRMGGSINSQGGEGIWGDRWAADTLERSITAEEAFRAVLPLRVTSCKIGRAHV